MEDGKIVDLFLARDEAAIRAAAESYGPRLRRLAARICGGDAAEECVNDAWLDAWNAIPPHEPRTYLFAFLARITRLRAIDRRRADERQTGGVDLVPLTQELAACLPGGEDAADAVDGALLSAAVSAFLRTIPEQRRNVFLRRYWYMDSVGDIARRFSLREGTVKTILFRTRNALKDYLIKEGYTL